MQNNDERVTFRFGSYYTVKEILSGVLAKRISVLGTGEKYLGYIAVRQVSVGWAILVSK